MPPGLSNVTQILHNFVAWNNSLQAMILVIGRAERYSPNSVEKDAAIISRVSEELGRRGFGIAFVGEDAFDADAYADAYVSMGRNSRTLSLLAELEEAGAVVVNSASAVELCCDRSRLTDLLWLNGVPVPPARGTDGYWLKRAHGVSQTRFDIQFAACEADVDAARKLMRSHGVGEVMVTAHVVGDLLKFYGVKGTDFFFYCYPGDAGQTKFGDELRNGHPHHYAFSVEKLKAMAGLAAQAVGIDVYGGDCIVRPDGSLCLIDFNDWPSFSACRDDAASAIADVVAKRISLAKPQERLWKQMAGK